jgi:hypothetical protein
MKIHHNNNGKLTNIIWNALKRREAELKQQDKASCKAAETQVPSEIVIKTAKKDISFKLTQSQWIQLGQKTGWIKEAQSFPEDKSVSNNIDVYAILQDTPKGEREQMAQRLLEKYPELADEINNATASIQSNLLEDEKDFNSMRDAVIDVNGSQGGHEEVDGPMVPDHASSLLKKPLDDSNLL